MRLKSILSNSFELKQSITLEFIKFIPDVPDEIIPSSDFGRAASFSLAVIALVSVGLVDEL